MLMAKAEAGKVMVAEAERGKLMAEAEAGKLMVAKAKQGMLMAEAGNLMMAEAEQLYANGVGRGREGDGESLR